MTDSRRCECGAPEPCFAPRFGGEHVPPEVWSRYEQRKEGEQMTVWEPKPDETPESLFAAVVEELNNWRWERSTVSAAEFQARLDADARALMERFQAACQNIKPVIREVSSEREIILTGNMNWPDRRCQSTMEASVGNGADYFAFRINDRVTVLSYAEARRLRNWLSGYLSQNMRAEK